MKVSNLTIRNLLAAKSYLIPADLQEDASKLVTHYDAWLAEYNHLRPNGVRNPDVPYVFVGPQGFPFPTDAETHFLSRYAKLMEKGINK